MSANFVENTLTQSEAIETYTPYDVTSSRPRETKIAFFANFGGIEKLFCAPEQSLNSKLLNQCITLRSWRIVNRPRFTNINTHSLNAENPCMQGEDKHVNMN